MKKENKKNFLELFAKVALHTAVTEANSACVFFSYQPRVPEQLKKENKCKKIH